MVNIPLKNRSVFVIVAHFKHKSHLGEINFCI